MFQQYRQGQGCGRGHDGRPLGAWPGSEADHEGNEFLTWGKEEQRPWAWPGGLGRNRGVVVYGTTLGWPGWSGGVATWCPSLGWRRRKTPGGAGAGPSLGEARDLLTSCLPFIRHTSMSLGLERQVSFCGQRAGELEMPSPAGSQISWWEPRPAQLPTCLHPSSPAGTAAPWMWGVPAPPGTGCPCDRGRGSQVGGLPHPSPIPPSPPNVVSGR